MCKTKEEKWKKWLVQIIQDSVTLHTDLQNYKQFVEIIYHNKGFMEHKYNSPYFIKAIQRWFMEYSLVILRRNLKPTWNKKTAKSKKKFKEESFSSLLLDIYRESKKKNPLLERRRFVKRRAELLSQNRAHSEFRAIEKEHNEINANDCFNEFASPKDNYFDPEKIYKDYRSFKKMAKKYEKYTDKSLLHSEKPELELSSTIGEYEKAINGFHELVMKYAIYFSGGSTAKEATIPGNWTWFLSNELKIP